MVDISADAACHLRELRDHYDERCRPQAALNLEAAVARAIHRIGTAPEQGLLAPRPYPGLATDSRRWVKQGRYWFVYSLTRPPVILAVFYDQADIPGRVRSDG